MHTLVQIIYSKYATELPHFSTNRLRQVWPASVHCWAPVDRAPSELTQIVRDKNH